MALARQLAPKGETANECVVPAGIRAWSVEAGNSNAGLGQRGETIGPSRAVATALLPTHMFRRQEDTGDLCLPLTDTYHECPRFPPFSVFPPFCRFVLPFWLPYHGLTIAPNS